MNDPERKHNLISDGLLNLQTTETLFNSLDLNYTGDYSRL